MTVVAAACGIASACALFAASRTVQASPAIAAESTAASSSVQATPSAQATASASATASAQSTASQTGYALDFTLPTYGKSGCLVCHGDPNLVVSGDGGNKSFYVDPDEYAAGAHATVQCPGCHVDYGYKAPHNAPGVDWRATAKQACKNCHPNQFRDYSLGVHAVRPTTEGQPDPKADSKPLCGDCHPGHGMKKAGDDRDYDADLHLSGGQMCGASGCHEQFSTDFADYYHGAAYTAGALDSPACWDCHGPHTVLPSKDRTSPTNVAQLGTTCGKCHEGASERYDTYVKLIHNKQDVLAANPLYATVSGITSGIKGLFD